MTTIPTQITLNSASFYSGQVTMALFGFSFENVVWDDFAAMRAVNWFVDIGAPLVIASLHDRKEGVLRVKPRG